MYLNKFIIVVTADILDILLWC